MPPLRNKEKFQQLTQFERGKIISLREGGFSYRAIGTHVQRDSSTVMRVWKQWTYEHRTTRKTSNGRQKVTSVRDDRHLLRMAVNVGTASFRQFAARWSTATGLLMSDSAAPWIACKGAFIQDPLTTNHRWLHLQWAQEHRAWQADWHQVVFADESRFSLWDHDRRICVRHCAGERCLPEYVIERHSGITPKVMVWGAISYHVRSNLLRIEGNLNRNRYVREVLQPEVIPFLQGFPGAIFQHDNTRPHCEAPARGFPCSLSSTPPVTVGKDEKSRK
ncbi:transposable element Tc1 transposase [Trichonephila clavipes]|nr:transposable element Tc1 transposase [Trichonephila clavipes]